MGGSQPPFTQTQPGTGAFPGQATGVTVPPVDPPFEPPDPVGPDDPGAAIAIGLSGGSQPPFTQSQPGTGAFPGHAAVLPVEPVVPLPVEPDPVVVVDPVDPDDAAATAIGLSGGSQPPFTHTQPLTGAFPGQAGVAVDPDPLPVEADPVEPVPPAKFAAALITMALFGGNQPRLTHTHPETGGVPVQLPTTVNAAALLTVVAAALLASAVLQPTRVRKRHANHELRRRRAGVCRGVLKRRP